MGGNGGREREREVGEEAERERVVGGEGRKERRGGRREKVCERACPPPQEREVRRQHAARQREVDSQRRAGERTQRLLAHLRQQEIDRGRRLFQQQLEREKAEQLKRPTEDLIVRDSAPLPMLGRVGWMQLPAHAFADLLMTIEFSKSFDEFLELDPPPTIPELYGGLYNIESCRGTLLRVFVQFLKAVLYDPGELTF